MNLLIDKTKLSRINEAAVELIVKNGYSAITVSTLARRAGVSERMLYQLHKSKQDLFNHLLFSKISPMLKSIDSGLEEGKSLKEVLKMVIDYLFSMAKEKPKDLKFLYVLIHDYDFQTSYDIQEQIRKLIEKALTKGKERGEINSQVGYEDLYNVAISYPIVFFNLRFRNFFGKSTLNDEDRKHVLEFSVHALK
ncbi:MAG: TetR/AcrR family transcriptional regulator [Bacteroidales bacterium]|nr:TetR/AcrR family transcriptional regulator [Bacteroidales bacterium]